MKYLIPGILVLQLLSGCSPEKETFEEEFYRWKNQRLARLKSPEGWLNLAGLYWLEEGENTFGSDSSNRIVFPSRAPARLGRYLLSGDTVRFVPEEGSGVMNGADPARSMIIKTDREGSPTLLEQGSLAWFIIKRGEKYGIRLRDLDNPAVKALKSIETYPPDEDWRIEAEFEAFPEPRNFSIPTMLNTEEAYLCPGILHFRIGSKDQELYPMESGKRLFLIFADETSGQETYGGGRFLYTDKPGRRGRVLIDFNRAYNPPCAYTPFATCPLPPKENILTVRIEAGEKFSGGH